MEGRRAIVGDVGWWKGGGDILKFSVENPVSLCIVSCEKISLMSTEHIFV